MGRLGGGKGAEAVEVVYQETGEGDVILDFGAAGPGGVGFGGAGASGKGGVC